MQTYKRSPEPFYYTGGKTGILLVHGFTGTPSEMRPMGEFFHSKGYSVYAPLLAGHGTNPEELRTTSWHDWWETVYQTYQCMKAEGMEKIVAVGLSMGGALTLYLASKENLQGVVTLCSPIWVRDKRAKYANYLQYIVPYVPKRKKKPAFIEKYLASYDRTPLRSVENLNRLIREVRSILSEVTTPALIVQSRHDETVDPKSAPYIYDHISSEVKKLSWYEKSSHIITLDKERKKLFLEVDEFIKHTCKQH